MPARTGSTTYVPGKGAYTSKSSGKKTFVGKGPAPAGSEKLPEPTVAQATARPRGPSPAAVKAKARNRRMRAALRSTGLGKSKLPVAAEIKAPPAKLAKVRQAVQAEAEEFKSEQNHAAPKLPTVKVVAHTRSAPKVAPRHEAAVKRVKAQLQKAEAHSQHLTGELGPEQRRFIRGVSKRTHLNPRTIAAQARAEEGSGSQTEAEQSHNFLNMGPGIKYGSLKEAIQATAANYNDTSSPNYAGVRAARGQGAEAQVAAIASSPWGTGPLIQKTLPEVGLKGKPVSKALLAKAKALGINAKAPNAGPAPKQVIRKYSAALKTMKAIDSEHSEYVWGGGHGGFEGPYDCSGAISAMIHSVDPKLKAPLVSGSMGQALQAGPGAITVFYNGVHTFAYIPALHKYWGTSKSNPGGGAGFFPKSVGDSEVASGNSGGAYNVGHIPGLGKKEAFQLGATSLGSAQSFPGMTLSSSGSQATINQGAGATVSKPGFSDKPIHLTPRQKFKQLNELGVGVSHGSGESGPSVKTLKQLDAKYEAAA